ncbi:MAG: hypothetical protein WC722_16640 [Rhodospirillales bacterium]|jgi:hypothetical protein
MAEFMMKPISQNDIGERTIFNTGVSTVGKGGDDYFCGHCGRKMIHNMNLSAIEATVVYQCGGCQSYNLPPETESPDETASV